jgi:anti-sigma regulatory factor (Ser/Thr protein kinase)
LTALGKVSAGTATVRHPRDVDPVLDILSDVLRRAGFDLQETLNVRIAVREAVVNAVQHGHRDDITRQVRIRYLINHAGLLAQVEDEGTGFRPDRVVGRGLELMRQHMTEVSFNSLGNCVTLIKRRGLAAPPA